MAGDQDQIFSMEFGKMAGEDDEDVIVSLPGDTGAVITKAADAVVVKTGGTPVDDPVEDLKGQFAAMTQRATAAEQRAQQAVQQVQETNQRLQQVEGQVVTSQLDTVLSGIAAADAEAANAEQAYTAAFEAGDGAAMARAQRLIAGAETRKQRLLEAKDDLEEVAQRRPAPGAQQRPAAPARVPAVDPVEQFAQGMSPRSAAWIRSHPECITDAKLNARMLAAHNLALAEDVVVDSDEYFQRIEAGIKVARPAAPAKAAPDGRRPSSAAAPASGAGGALNGGTEVRLTKGEAQSATDGTLVWGTDSPDGKFKKGEPLGLAEMARRKHFGMLAGLYDKAAGSF
jgi:hypothetical protein